MKYQGNPEALSALTKLTKCTHCSHREDEPHFLPSPGKGINPSGKWLFHYADTHGLEPIDVLAITLQTIYGMTQGEAYKVASGAMGDY